MHFKIYFNFRTKRARYMRFGPTCGGVLLVYHYRIKSLNQQNDKSTCITGFEYVLIQRGNKVV